MENLLPEPPAMAILTISFDKAAFKEEEMKVDSRHKSIMRIILDNFNVFRVSQ
jgi:hypothetical protein